jgi:hypothetical protein
VPRSNQLSYAATREYFTKENKKRLNQYAKPFYNSFLTQILKEFEK